MIASKEGLASMGIPPTQTPRHATTTSRTSLTPSEFVQKVGYDARTPVRFEGYPSLRGRTLLAGAAWNMIAEDSRVIGGRIDLADVCAKLKGKAMCDGRGPAFMESEIKKALDECTKEDGGGDDLL